MKLFSLLMLVPALTAWAETSEHIEKSFSLPANGQLVVDVGLGSIEVTTHEANEVRVSAFRKVTQKDKSTEESFLRTYPVTFSQNANKLTIRSAEKIAGGGWFGSKRTEARYTITVPARFHVQLKTSGGGIAVNDLTGKVKANTSGGGLNFVRLHGSVEGQTSGGGISVTECAGSFKLSTSGGGITLDHVGGDIDGSSSGGAIVARFATAPSGDVHLETSGGGVTVRVPKNSAFNLDASTSGGEVSSDLPVTVTGVIRQGRLTGTVNGGGKLLFLRSSGGGINLVKH